MTGWPDEQELIEQFRQWFREFRPAEPAVEDSVEAPSAVDAPSLPDASPPEVGVYRLAEEFTALRHELKLQTKSGRSLQERLEAVLGAMEQALEQVRRAESRAADAASQGMRPLVETLAAFDDAVQRGRAVLETTRQRALQELPALFCKELDAAFDGLPFWRRWAARPLFETTRRLAEQRAACEAGTTLESLASGYELIAGRLEKALREEGIERIACLGRPVDPHCMTVVAVVGESGFAPGTVVEEIRRGYFWNGKVLRFAEVTAAARVTPLEPGQAAASLGRGAETIDEG